MLSCTEIDKEYQEISLDFATRFINSGPVIMVSSAYKDLKGVMTVAWNMPVQKSPPMVIIGMGKSHFTTGIVEKSKEFAVNIPGRDSHDIMKYCGTVSGKDVNKFESGKLGFISGETIGAPLIVGMLGYLECEVVKQVELKGAHLYFGQVNRCLALKDCFSDTWNIDDTRVRLIHHLGGPDFYNSPNP